MGHAIFPDELTNWMGGGEPNYPKSHFRASLIEVEIFLLQRMVSIRTSEVHSPEEIVIVVGWKS